MAGTHMKGYLIVCMCGCMWGCAVAVVVPPPHPQNPQKLHLYGKSEPKTAPTSMETGCLPRGPQTLRQVAGQQNMVRYLKTVATEDR